MIELDTKSIYKPDDATETKQKITNWLENLERRLDVIEKLLHAIARSELYSITHNKSETERYDTEKELKANTQSYEERKHNLTAKSNNINDVLKIWEKECGTNNRWVKALKGFRDAGGGMRWYSGYPHPGAFIHFTLLDPNGKELHGQKLQDIKDYTRQFITGAGSRR